MNINYRALKNICYADKDYFDNFGDNLLKDRKLIYINNNSSVLGIAHLDTVQSKKHFKMSDENGKRIIKNPQLDDRLGVYTLLHHLPLFGINVDILLTDDEEIGMSTAQYFKPTKDYNWMFQFDRRADDIVFYQYGSKKLRKTLMRSGFIKQGSGSFSDISYLDYIGCEGFNVGCGYSNEHSLHSQFDVNVYNSQIKSFVNFHKNHANTFYRYKPGTSLKMENPNNIYEYSYYWDKDYQKYMRDVWQYDKK